MEAEIKERMKQAGDNVVYWAERMVQEQKGYNNPAELERMGLERMFWLGKEEAYKDCYAMTQRRMQ